MTMEVRGEQHNNLLKEKNCQTPILYLVKFTFRNEREIKTFSNEEKPKKFVTKRLI